MTNPTCNIRGHDEGKQVTWRTATTPARSSGPSRSHSEGQARSRAATAPRLPFRPRRPSGSSLVRLFVSVRFRRAEMHPRVSDEWRSHQRPPRRPLAVQPDRIEVELDLPEGLQLGSNNCLA